MTGDNMMAVLLRPLTMQRAVKAYIRSQKPESRGEVQKMRIQQLLAYAPWATFTTCCFMAGLPSMWCCSRHRLRAHPLP